MFAQHTDLDEFYTETPLALLPLERLCQHHHTFRTTASPLFAFIYLIAYHDQQGILPYDYVPVEHFGAMELDLLGKALVAYSANPNYAVMWLDQMFYLLDEQEQDDDLLRT